jgi:hypothetical protein
MSDELEAYLPLFEIEAERRAKPYNTRKLAPDNELKGIIGEAEFAKAYDQPMNWAVAGDGGIDFTVPLAFKFNVKCAEIPKYLIHEYGKVVADIYVLGKYLKAEKRCKFLGWETGEKLRAAPFKDFGYGIINHYIAREELRDMDDIDQRVMHLVAGPRA